MQIKLYMSIFNATPIYTSIFNPTNWHSYLYTSIFKAKCWHFYLHTSTLIKDFIWSVIGFCITSTAYSHLRTNHTFTILLHQFKTNVTKSQVCPIHCYNVKNQPSIYQSTITHVSIPFYIPQVLSTGTCLTCLWLWAGWPLLFCGLTQAIALTKCI